MKKIKLTQGKFAIVDDEDFEKLNKYKWCVAKCRNSWYAVHDIRTGKSRKRIYMHRQILHTKPGQETDHRNCNGLDNQRRNLRLATNQENHFNQRINKRNTNGYKGISWYKATQKWKAQIGLNGKVIYLGLFYTLEAAAQAYNQAAIIYFGKFARINKINI